MVERVIIDTDPGIDDALALLFALQSSDLEVAAITTVSGNVTVDKATRNVMTILSLLPDDLLKVQLHVLSAKKRQIEFSASGDRFSSLLKELDGQ